jgi:methylated-DNA-protein-cysteine methyltransferase-like protein
MPQSRVTGPGFHRAVFKVVAKVPEGFVTTYGDVACLLGSRAVARHVGWALAALRQDDVPWHRVINARGCISFRGDTPRGILQQQRLIEEGHTFDVNGRLTGFPDHRFLYPEST